MHENNPIKLPQMSNYYWCLKMSSIWIYIRIFTTRCLKVKGYFCIPTFFYILQSMLFLLSSVGTFSADVKNQRPVLLSIKSDWKHNHRHKINRLLLLWLVHKRDYFLVMHSCCCVGNCNIHPGQKILVMNERKQYEIWSKLKVLVKKLSYFTTKLC
jgi:hypothetical protein